MFFAVQTFVRNDWAMHQINQSDENSLFKATFILLKLAFIVGKLFAFSMLG